MVEFHNSKIDHEFSQRTFTALSCGIDKGKKSLIFLKKCDVFPGWFNAEINELYMSRLIK